MRDMAGARRAHTLTPRQRQVLDYVAAFRATRGYPPTIREIGDHFGIRSPNAVMGHLNALRRKGAITSTPGRSRTLRPVTGLRLAYGGEVR